MDANTPTRQFPRFSVLELVLFAGAIVVSILPYIQWGPWGVPASILLAIFGCLVLREPNKLAGGLICASLLTGVFVASFFLFSLGGVGTIVGPILVTIFAYRALRERNWLVGGIQTMSLLTGVFVASFFVFLLFLGFGGLPASILVTVFACLMLHDRDGLGAGLVLVMALVMTLFASLMNVTRASTITSSCANNMMQIAMAIENYHEANGHYPPPYTTDENGRPLHSWRVLILPYLDQRDLYDRIDLTKPWHHPTNLALADPVLRIYQCPQYRREVSAEGVTTAYVAILGDHTAWPRSGTRKAEEIVDGLSNTLLLVESEKHRIHWMSTADPGVESLGPTSGNGETLLAQGPHRGEYVCAFCDGASRAVWPSYAFEDFLSLLTIDGGEDHNIPDWQKNPKRR